MDNKNKDDDFQVVVSGLDNSNVLITSDGKENVDDMWNKIVETSAFNFQAKRHQYSTIINEKSFGSSNSITVEDIEEYADNPQNDLSSIQEINKIIKTFVNKDDIIGRVYESIQIYTNPSYDLIYNNCSDDKKSKNKTLKDVTALIQSFNKQINIQAFLQQGVPLSYLNGTYVTYLRNTKDNYTIDTYPLGVVEISEFTVDGEPVVLFNVSTLKRKLKHTSRKNKNNKDVLFENVDEIVKNNYPDEVYKAYKNNEKYVVLDPKRVGVVRINNLDGLYGLSPIFKALKPAIVLNSIEASDDSTVKARGKKIIHQKLRKEIAGTDYQKQALSEMSYAHENFIEAWKNKTVLVTTPWWIESIEYVEPNTDTTNKDTLNTYRNKEFTALGISFLDTYNATLDVSKISIDGLMKYIDTIVGQFAGILNKYYKVVCENTNKKYLALCPEIQMRSSETMSMDMRKNLAEFMISKMSASYETAYNILGISNAETEAQKRVAEKEKGYDEIFAPHANYFTQSGNGGSQTNNDDGKNTGRPKGEETNKQLYDKTRNEIKNKGGGGNG